MNLKNLAINFLGRALTSAGYSPGPFWSHDLDYSPSYTGKSVTEATALATVAVYACVRILSETLASLPLILYRRLPRGKERATDHPLYSILHDSPNPEMSAFNFKEALMAHLVTWGNNYAEIEWEDRLTVKGLWPLRPDRIQAVRENENIVYKYNSPTGMVSLPSYRVLHIPGLSFDGLVGYAPITLAREAIGLSLATEEFGARFFGNGSAPGGALKHPKTMSKEAKENLRKAWNEQHSGLENQHKVAILEEGLDWVKIGIPPNDAQFLETRKFQKNEIASFFHIPPHMIGDLERATFSNIEEQALEFVVYTMRPWLVRWEQAINQKLLNPNERKEYFVEFLVDALLRGNFESRTRGYWQAIQGGWMSPNEVRDLENRNPREGGDEYLQPVNMVISGKNPYPGQ
jgi:HK97 family phage portal protein